MSLVMRIIFVHFVMGVGCQPLNTGSANHLYDAIQANARCLRPIQLMCVY